jgi:hypothetical protein
MAIGGRHLKESLGRKGLADEASLTAVLSAVLSAEALA